VLLPRIQLTSGEERMPFQLGRRQFPVRLAFAMTINKSQGQTFDKIGVYLPRPVFAHGQLYVAFSRVRRMEDVSVMLDRDGVAVTRNVVYRELLRDEVPGAGMEEEGVEGDDVGVPYDLEHKYDHEDNVRDDDMPPLVPPPPLLQLDVQSIRGIPPATGAALTRATLPVPSRRPLSDISNVDSSVSASHSHSAHKKRAQP
jgi:hypothetical protein